MSIGLNDNIFHLVSRVALLMTSKLKKELARAGITSIKPAYVSILMCLWEKEKVDALVSKFGYLDGMKMAELGRSAGLESSSMTGLIDRMERDGLVTRSVDKVDRRALRVCLTKTGAEMQQQVLDLLNKTVEAFYLGISDDKIEIFSEVLRTWLVNQNRLQP